MRVLSAGGPLAGGERRRAGGWSGPDLELYDELTASENLLFFRRVGGSPATAAEVSRRLDAVGLEGRGDHRVGEFSSGMKQRLRAAFALLFDPPIVLLDEPYTGLDAEGRALVGRLVSEQRRGGAVVLASNDQRDFEAPDRTIRLGSVP